MDRIRFQLALDLTDFEKAAEVSTLVEPLVDVFELGTPLLRRYGVNAIRMFRERFPLTCLVADWKTMDCGQAEAVMAFDAGADGVIVQAAAPRPTIEAACNEALSRGKFVMADSLGIYEVGDLLSRVRGASLSHVVLHLGKDEQGIGGDISAKHARRVAEALAASHIKLALAGGLTAQSIESFQALENLDVAVIGEAVIRSSRPLEVATEIRRACLREKVM
ncbi:orotidine 5'-phosphate decarboxylase / HUMPS family protein [Actinomadura napierensis]|uniref:3-hexulose-6-phosphate synthase n=1 Tax=Actinomadura napierensis TaxID=267854 RepID=A0ABP5LZE6_9ACTN